MPPLGLSSSRTLGKALIVGSPACRRLPVEALAGEGITSVETDCPYLAMAEIARKPMAYRTLVISLQSVYVEELALIATIRTHHPHIEVWLSQTDGRPAALAEALRLGADGLLAEDGLHRLVAHPEPPAAPAPPAIATPASNAMRLQADPEPLAEPWQRPVRAAEAVRKFEAAGANGAQPPAAQPARSTIDNPLLPPSPVGPEQPAAAASAAEPPDTPLSSDDWQVDVPLAGEPILTADELRALLQEPSSSSYPPNLD